MSGYNIISPLVVTDDERAQNYARGLGNTPVNPFAAGVQGLEQGLTFGVNLMGKVQDIQRENDPDKLAAEQLQRELSNEQTRLRNEGLATANDLKDQYGADQIEADLAYKGALTDKIENTANGVITPSEQLKEQLIRAHIENVRTSTANMKAKKASANAPLTPEQRGQFLRGEAVTPTDQGTAGENDSAAPPGMYDDDGEFPMPMESPPQQGPRAQMRTTDPQTSLNMLDNSQKQTKEARTSYVHGVVKSIVGGSGNPIQSADGTAYGTGSRDKQGQLSVDLPSAADYDSPEPLDAPTAFATLTNLNNLHKKITQPEEAKIVAGATSAIFSKVPMDEMQDFIDSAPEKQRPYLQKQRDYAAAMLAAQGNPQYLSPPQKAIQAAKMPFSSLVDPTGTYKTAMGILTDGFTATDDVEFKSALRNNQYYAALGQASKNGTQAVSVREVPTPPTNDTLPDLANPGEKPATVLEYRGTDGTSSYAPTPAVDPDNPNPKEQLRMGQAAFVDEIAKQHKDNVSLNNQTQANIQGAQSAAGQGAFRQPPPQPSAEPTPTPTPEEQNPAEQRGQLAKPEETPAAEPTPIELDKAGTTAKGFRLSPHTDLMEDFYANKYRSEHVPTTTAGINKANENATTYARLEVQRYDKDTKPLLDAAGKADDQAQQVIANNEKLRELMQRAKDEGYADLFGPGAIKEARRQAILTAPVGETGRKEAAFIRDFNRLAYENLRTEAKGSASTLRAVAEQKFALQSMPALDMDFDSITKLADDREHAASTIQNVTELTRMLQERGHFLKRPGIERIVDEYGRSGAANPAKPNFQTPEEYLYGAPKKPEQKKKEVPGAVDTDTGGNITPPPNTPDISTPQNQGDVVGAGGAAGAQKKSLGADLTGSFNTELSPEEKQGFEAWKKSLPKNLQSTYDYDLQGFYKASGGPAYQEGAHLPDTFKKPNHPTFSDESQYSTPESPGGHWDGDTFVSPKAKEPAATGIGRLLPDWVSYDNFKRGLKEAPADFGRGVDQFKTGASELVTHPVGSAETLVTKGVPAAGAAVRNVIIGSPEERAQAQKSLAGQRAQQDPEFRKHVDDLKSQIRLEKAAHPMEEAFNWVMDSMTPPAIERVGNKITNASDSVYDSIVNKAQSLWKSPEEIDKSQRERERDRVESRTAGAEVSEDLKLENPWSNAASQALGFGILSAATGAAGSAAKAGGLKALTKLNNPIVNDAIKGIEKLSTGKYQRWLLNRGQEAGKDAAAYAIPQKEGTLGENLETGAIGGQLARGLGWGASRTIEAARAGAARLGVGAAQRAPEAALAAEFSKTGVNPEGLDQSVAQARAMGGNALGTLPEGAASTVEDISSSPAVQSTINPGERAANKQRAGADLQSSAGIAEGQVPAQEETTAAYRKAVTERRDAFLKESEGAAEGERAQRLSTSIEERNAALGNQAQTVNKLTNDVVEGIRTDAKSVAHELTDLTEKAAPEVSSDYAGGSIPSATIQDRVKALDAVKTNLQESYKPAYKAVGEKMVRPDAEELDGLYQRLRAENPSAAQEAIRKANINRGYPADQLDSMKPDFDFLDQLHREFRLAANKQFGSASRSGMEKIGAMRDEVATFLDNQITRPGGPSETPYSDLGRKYKNVRDVEDRIDSVQGVLSDIDAKMNLDKGPPENLQQRYFGSGDKVAKMNELLGEEGASRLKQQLGALDAVHGQLKTSGENITKYQQKGSVPADAVLPENLKEAYKLTGGNESFGDSLLNAKDIEHIKQVTQGLGEENHHIAEAGVLRALKRRINAKSVNIQGEVPHEILGLKERQWNNAKAVLPEDQISALENYAQRAKNLEKADRVIATEGKVEVSRAHGNLPHTRTGWIKRGAGFVVDFLTNKDFRVLTDSEKKSITKALMDLKPENVNETLSKVSELMKNPKSDAIKQLREYAPALAYGSAELITQPSEREVKRRRTKADAARRAVP